MAARTRRVGRWSRGRRSCPPGAMHGPRRRGPAVPAGQGTRAGLRAWWRTPRWRPRPGGGRQATAGRTRLGAAEDGRPSGDTSVRDPCRGTRAPGRTDVRWPPPLGLPHAGPAGGGPPERTPPEAGFVRGEGPPVPRTGRLPMPAPTPRPPPRGPVPSRPGPGGPTRRHRPGSTHTPDGEPWGPPQGARTPFFRNAASVA